MTEMEENVKNGYPEEDVQVSAGLLSLEFLRDSRRYCRKLDCEVEE